jgi:hypothetical protein
MKESTGGDIPDTQWIMVTMDNGLSFVVGGGWSLPQDIQIPPLLGLSLLALMALSWLMIVTKT